MTSAETLRTMKLANQTVAQGENEAECARAVAVSPTPLQDTSPLTGRRAAMLQFSGYPTDPRPFRAAETLARAGMSVDVICLADAETPRGSDVLNGVRIRRLPIRHSRGSKRDYLWQYGAFIAASFALLTARSLLRRYDLVHIHNMPDVLVFSALVPRLLGAKLILDLHDPMPELMMSIFQVSEEHRGVRLLKRLERYSTWFAHRVLTVNRRCRRIFSERSCPPEKVTVIMNAPDEEIFAYRAFAGRTEVREIRPFVIMYHGTITERHGLDLAIQALATVHRTVPQAELRICGASTPFLEKVLSSIRGSEIATTVHYLGPKSLVGIAEEIDRCDVGIIPNRRNTFTELNTPTRIFEFLARGKPVIAPAAPGIQDYFSCAQMLYFELGSAPALARQLEYVFFHPEETQHIVTAGQSVYLSHRWTGERDRYINTVSELLAHSSRTTARSAETSPA